MLLGEAYSSRYDEAGKDIQGLGCVAKGTSVRFSDLLAYGELSQE
jgi:hypothetical protein